MLSFSGWGSHRDASKEYNSIKDRLSAHIGELVLVERKIQKTKFIGGFVGTEGGAWPAKYSIGVIKEPGLPGDISEASILDLGGYEISVEPMAVFSPFLSPSKSIDELLQLKEENIKFDFKDLSLAEYKEPDMLGGTSDVKILKFNVYAGDEEVKKFLNKKFKYFERPLYDDVNSFMKDKEKITALREYKIKKQKEDIITRLESLLKKELNLIGEIKSIDKTLKAGGDYDEAESFLLTLKENDGVRGIRHSIRNTIEKAKELNMHTDKGEYIVETVPGKQTKIIICDYISGLEKKYAQPVKA